MRFCTHFFQYRFYVNITHRCFSAGWQNWRDGVLRLRHSKAAFHRATRPHLRRIQVRTLLFNGLNSLHWNMVKCKTGKSRRLMDGRPSEIRRLYGRMYVASPMAKPWVCKALILAIIFRTGKEIDIASISSLLRLSQSLNRVNEGVTRLLL